MLVPLVFEQPSLGPKIVPAAYFTSEPNPVRPDHVPPVRVEVLEDFSAQLTRVRLDVSVSIEVLFELVTQQEAFTAYFTDLIFGPVFVLAFLVRRHPLD